MNEKNTELRKIEAVIHRYTEGLRTGDTELLRRAFHPRAMMYGASPRSVTVVEIEGLYQFVDNNTAPAQTGEPYTFFIKGIQLDGLAACVEMVEESAYGNNYTDYFQLLKIEGEWVIMSKLYYMHPAQ